jgi:hypothetical protein
MAGYAVRLPPPWRVLALLLLLPAAPLPAPAVPPPAPPSPALPLPVPLLPVFRASLLFPSLINFGDW